MTDALEIFRALADPTRLRILALLRAMELSIGELAQVLGQSQPRVSRHVKILADAGIAERRKEGSWVFLGLGDRAGLGRCSPPSMPGMRRPRRITGRWRISPVWPRYVPTGRVRQRLILMPMPPNGTKCARCISPRARLKRRSARR